MLDTDQVAPPMVYLTLARHKAEIRRNHETLKLDPITNKLLCCFIAKQNELLSRQQLIDQVWQSHYVSDDAINRAISVLRKTLGGRIHDFIVTAPKLGYRFQIPNHVVFTVVDQHNERADHCQQTLGPQALHPQTQSPQTLNPQKQSHPSDRHQAPPQQRREDILITKSGHWLKPAITPSSISPDQQNPVQDLHQQPAKRHISNGILALIIITIGICLGLCVGLYIGPWELPAATAPNQQQLQTKPSAPATNSG